MANIKSETENYYIIANGSVLTFKGEILSIEFSNCSNEPLKINFIFSNNPEKSGKIEARPSEDGSLNVTTYNASGISGTAEPLLIARSPKTLKEIYLSFSFQQVRDSFTLHYTIFEQK